MVYISRNSCNSVFSLNNYIEFVHENVDETDFECVCDTSWSLLALANDREFLLNIYHESLKRSVSDASQLVTYSPQSILLHREPEFIVRANIWPPARKRYDSAESAIFSYEVPHNHNFNFCTAGYFGPGYKTHLFRCESDLSGYVGEEAELTGHNIEMLSPGTLMVYEAFKDVHTQLTPESVSVSINLLCADSALDIRPQCLFDIEEGCVAGSVGSNLGRTLYIIDLLRHIHNEESIDLLCSIANDHDSVSSRALALNVLNDVRPDEHHRLFGRVPKDVRELSSKELIIGDDFMNYSMQQASKSTGR